MTVTYVVLFEVNNDTAVWRGEDVDPVGDSYILRLLPGRPGYSEIGMANVTLCEIERRLTEHGLRCLDDERVDASHLRARVVRLFFGDPHGPDAPLVRFVYDEASDLDG